MQKLSIALLLIACLLPFGCASVLTEISLLILWESVQLFTRAERLVSIVMSGIAIKVLIVLLLQRLGVFILLLLSLELSLLENL